MTKKNHYQTKMGLGPQALLVTLRVPSRERHPFCLPLRTKSAYLQVRRG